jgi:hypothetical protein
MAEKHRLHVMKHCAANTTIPPKNPGSYIRTSTKDVLDDPQWGEKGDDQPAHLTELETALLNGNLHPSDAKTMVTCLHMGRPIPADLAARVKTALSPKTGG